MTYAAETRSVAFAGHAQIASGSLGDVALAVKRHADAHPEHPVLVFASADASPIDLDLRGSPAEVVARLEHAPPRERGRPKLGVTGREVTLLPRHWEWLAAQPGGASVALRKLVEAAMRDPAEQARQARDAAYRFMSALGGDLPGFEAASRALFAGDAPAFRERVSEWPTDVRDHLLLVADGAFA